MIQRVGQAPKPGISYRLRPGVYAILPLGGQLLVTHQGGADEPLQLPGGGIDPGESPIQSLHREVFEETGWHIARPRRMAAARRYIFMPEYDLWAEKLCTIYIAHPVRRHGPPSETNHSVNFIDTHMAPDLLDNPVDRLMTQKALRAGLIR